MIPVIGIDPGVNGGLAVLNDLGQALYIRAFEPRMTPEGLRCLVAASAGLLKREGGSFCFLERVGYMPTDGGKGAFTFGRVVGLLEMAVICHDLALHYVPPMLWQAKLGCLSGGNKNVTKRAAQALFPDEKITHAVADALLIAVYGQRMLAQLG